MEERTSESRKKKGRREVKKNTCDVLKYLINRVHFFFNDGWGDDVIDVGHSLQHALAVPLALVLVTELKGFMDTYEQKVLLYSFMDMLNIILLHYSVTDTYKHN